jgi:acyl-CoA synthetase (AMP-forming)/AMP-acid ligase II
MTDNTVYQRFEATTRRLASQSANAPFLHVLQETADIYGIDAGDISYVTMLDRVQEAASRFAAQGYGPGLRVGLLLENRPLFLQIWLALNSLGVSVVPINPDLRTTELEYLIEHSEMCLAIVLPDRAADIRTAIDNAGLDTPVINSIDDLLAVGTGTSGKDQPMVLTRHTECALLYTSGTTGKPKGCILSNEYFLHSGDWYAQTGGHISLQMDTERMITPLPLFHMNAMAVSVTAMISVGGCLVLVDRFHPRTWWDSVRQSRATVLHYLGVMPSMLMAADATEADRQHDVRFGFGAGVDKKLHAAFEQRFGFPLIEAWACTETGSGAVVSAHEEPRHIGTSCFGRPCKDVEVRVIDDERADVATGTPGELLVRRAGDNPRYGFFSGYLKNAEATDELWRDGWLNTGDVVVQDADGSLHFVDRRKNVIRRSGENIAAVEVESILNRHPDINMCAAAAAPDELRGDEVAVFIVLNAGDAGDGSGSDADVDVATGTEAKAVEIVHWSLEQMAYYKAPGFIAFIEELPVTATQKILRGELKTLLNETLDRGGFIDTRHLKKRQA